MTKDRYLLKLKHYNNSIQYTYSKVQFNPHFRDNKKNSSNNKKHDSLESQRCSLSRSISKIKELCLCNNFEYFFTITLKTPRRNDVLYSTSLINSQIREYAKTRKHFKYIYVFEKQEKGGIHVHGFVSRA